jgi:hypothetical protein
MFHKDIGKVDQDVVYVAMVIHVRSKLLFAMFHLFFHTYVAIVFIWMLHMFHTYIASVLSRCCVYFTMVLRCFCKCFQIHVSSVSSVFRRMLQVLHLDVSKIDRVLHLAPSSSSAASPRCLYLLLALAGHPNLRYKRAPPPPLLLNAGGAAGTDRREWRGWPLLLRYSMVP